MQHPTAPVHDDTTTLEGGYLPPAWLAAQPTPPARHTLTFGAWGRTVRVSVPHLTPAQTESLAQHVRAQAQQRLRRLPLERVLAALSRATARLLDPQDPVRQSLDRWLPVVSGFEPDMVRLGLNAYFKTFRRPQLQRFVVEDLGNPLLLDDFQPRPSGGWAQALGPDLLALVWAGNVPGLPMWSQVAALLVKAGSVGKVASAEPWFAGCYARLLAEVEPDLAEALAVLWWPGGHEDTERALFNHAEAVLAYGGQPALAQLQTRVPPGVRWLPHGHKLSLGLVSATALDAQHAPAVLRQAALDVVRWDQQGCYSPHQFYVERGAPVAPREFAQRLAVELLALQQRHPRRALALDEASAWRQEQQRQAWQAQACGGEAWADPQGQSSVVYFDRPQPLQPSATQRSVRVVAVEHLDDALPHLAAQRAWLQTVGLAASPEELFRLAPALARVGVTRMCALGAMSAPAPGWHHDGRFSLLDLVRMVDIEPSAETAADAWATYRD